jgi:hypothetical protein
VIIFYPLAYVLTIASVTMLFRWARYRCVADKRIRKHNCAPLTQVENSATRRRCRYL